MGGLRGVGVGSPAVILEWVVIGFLAAGVSGRFVVEKNSLVVTSPSELRGEHDSAIGNFGIPQYGGSMTGTVVWPSKNTDGCDEFRTSFRATPGSIPNIVLLDRGDCHFAKKVWRAQNAGASAVLVVDDTEEPLITMDLPQEDNEAAMFMQNITIPSALVEKSFGERLKIAYKNGETITINLDWREALPHPDDRIEYELWTSSNDACGSKCEMIMEFLKNFKGAAQIMEKGGYSQFTPHYITWYCPRQFISTKQCRSQCINHGRYCAPDPEQDFSRGYEGKDVVIENLRQLCVYKLANKRSRPWLWWDYVTDFQKRCPMKENKYNKDCADKVLKSLGFKVKDIDKCIGDPSADSENPILNKEQDSQVGKGSRGDVTILPTLVVNDRQYRGKLEKDAVLKAICAGFQESTEPTVCLRSDVETNECLNNNGGCWQDKASNVTACKDTFRGRVCECPVVQGVQFKGDGYTNCEASGLGRCRINTGGCWQRSRDGRTFSACVESTDKRCECPSGFRGDGVKTCQDINECKERRACQCPECRCKNTWGGYECTCSGDLLYIRDHDICIANNSVEPRFPWIAFWATLIGLAIASAGMYMVYKYRFRSYMNSEIRAIMAQYMPLENDGGILNHTQEQSGA